MKPGIYKNIFLRLLFSYMSTVILGLAVIGIVISFLAKGYIYDSKREELLRKAKKVNLVIQNEMNVNEATQQNLTFLDQSFDTRIWVFDRSGKIIATSTKDEVSIGKSVSEPIVQKVLKGENAVNSLKFEGITEPVLSVVIPWGKENNLYGGIVLHASVVGMNDTLGNIRETILWVTLLAALFSLAMVSYLSWSISRPLQKINRAAAEIGMGNYNERIHVDSSDEIGDLANTINKMAEKLERTETERRKFDQLRDDFLANVSHELKTPLTAMQGFLEALQDGLIREEAKQKYYGVMHHETMHMKRLVDDIMDLIKLETKQITLSKIPVDVESLLNKIAFKFKQEASKKGNKIQVYVKEELPKAYADQDRLEQILVNLIKNAIHFTADGIITIEGEKFGNDILLKVTDTGIGISDADQEWIWERFFKADRTRSKKDQGTGLGLAIVKELVELHQGKIILESTVGKGTTFNIWIPSIGQNQE